MPSLEAGVLGEATLAFGNFVQHFDEHYIRCSANTYAQSQDGDEESIFLQTYLSEWLAVGGGVEWSGADYNAWMRIVVNIADTVMRGEITCDYVGTPPPDSDRTEAYARPIVAIYQPGQRGDDFMDPARYAVEAYRWKRRGTAQLLVDYSLYED